MVGRVAGKMALVTGGAQGLGRAHCIRLAQEGARVLATDINGTGAEETAAIINAELGEGTAYGIAHDVTSPEQWEAAVDAAREKLGGLNVLVNNAGIGVPGNIEACDFGDWQRCFDINVNSIFHGCQKALPLMREHAPGSIINISSIAGLIASDTMPGYNASKAAVWMLSKSIALHCAKNNMRIRCNSIHPAAILTPMWEPMLGQGTDREANMASFVADTPLRRFGTATEVAALAVMLASDECRYMTGSERCSV